MLYMALMLGSGLFWTITYILIIRRSFQDRTYGMPLAALCANISWEFIFLVIYPPSITQRIVNLIWFSLDVVIFAQLLVFGPREFADLTKRIFYALAAVALASAFCAVLFVCIEFHDFYGIYAAFGQNLMMSVLFPIMLYRRRSLRGQSMGIAICKLLGTVMASLAFCFFYSRGGKTPLLLFLYISILVYDLAYVAMIYRQQHGAKGLSEPATELAKVQGVATVDGR